MEPKSGTPTVGFRHLSCAHGIGKPNDLGASEAYCGAADMLFFVRPAVCCVWNIVLYSVFHVYDTEYVHLIGTGSVKRNIEQAAI